MAEFVQLCYLDEDNVAAAMRFASSEEFAEVVKVLRLGSMSTKRKILDLGCGNGIASYAFAFLGHEVFAVDPDSSQDVGLGATARLASVVSNGTISTDESFAESLSFPDDTFDIVYARQALHHFSDLREGLAECKRVLKPKGLMLATREHVVNDGRQLETFLEGHILHRMHGGEHAYTLREYISALRQAGLTILKVFGPFDTVINHFPLSNAEIMERFARALRRRVGDALASIMIRIPFAEQFYRSRLSCYCQEPGRTYSFLCLK